MRPSELGDLATIARAWNVPVATAGYALRHRALRECRGLAPDLGGPMHARLARVAAGLLSEEGKKPRP